MHLNCPHCRNPIEVISPNQQDEVVCPSCGSSFRLENERTSKQTTSEYHRQLGRFTLVDKIGTGAFGAVFKARDPQLDRTVAIKIPRAGNLPDGHDKERFLREARSVAQLRHPSIVSIYEVGEADDLPYIVSDFVEGVTLADYLTARRPTFKEAAELIAEVAEALDYAHSMGVVHRDVKPSNIMLQTSRDRKPVDNGQSNKLTPRLMDFGLAKRDAGEITMTVDGQVLGTPAYMSPEQAKGEAHTVDGRSDMYSLGVILYELLTGELPFRGNTRMLLHQVLNDEPRSPRSLNDRIPRDLETICLKSMAKEAGRRYQSAAALASDLGHWLKGEPIEARPVGRVGKAWRWCRRNPAVAGLVAGLALSLIMGLTLTTWQWLRAADKADAEAQARQEAQEARRQAEANFQRARDAVDEMLAEVGYRQLADIPLMASVRKKLLTRALAFYEDLLKERGDDPELRRQAGRTWRRMGEIHAMLDRDVDAERAYRQAIAVQEPLAAEQPTVPEYQVDLSDSYRQLGTLMHFSGRFPEAEQAFRHALALDERATAEFPAHFQVRFNQPYTCYHLGHLLQELGRLKEAEPLHRRALAASKRLVADFPDHREAVETLARSHKILAVLLQDTDQEEEAAASYRDALAAYEHLNQNWPRPDYRHEMSFLHNGLGGLLGDAGRFEDSLRHTRQAQALLERLAAEFPERPTYRRDLAWSHNSLSKVLRQTQRWTEAKAASQQAVVAYEQLVRDFPAAPANHSELGDALQSLATQFSAAQDLKETRRLLEQAIEHQRIAVQANPRQPLYRKFLRSHCLNLTTTLLALKEHAAAAQAAGDLARAVPGSAPDACLAASFLAACAALGKQDANPSETKRAELERAYGEQAIHWLQQAVNDGFGDAERLRQDDFASLHSRPDFQRLLRDLEQRAKTPSPE